MSQHKKPTKPEPCIFCGTAKISKHFASMNPMMSLYIIGFNVGVHWELPPICESHGVELVQAWATISMSQDRLDELERKKSELS